MKKEMNSAMFSKINWTAGVMAIANMMIIAGKVPEEYVPHILTLANVAAPILIMVFRTWFTEPKS